MYCPKSLPCVPSKLAVSGKQVSIDTDFRHWLHFWRVLTASDLTNIEKQNIALLNIFGKIPADVEGAMSACIDFYLCGKNPPEDRARERLLDWDADWLCIWADFKLYARIDLDRTKLHWWRFMALFESLPKYSGIKQRISTRGIDLSKIKDPETREEYRRMKEAVALDWEDEDADDFYARL